MQIPNTEREKPRVELEQSNNKMLLATNITLTQYNTSPLKKARLF